MKNLILGLFILGLTNLSFSQNTLAYTTIDVPKNHTSTTEITNAQFVNAVSTNQIPQRAQNFQQYSAKFDVTTVKDYKPDSDSTYKVVFTESNNSIQNIYDANGTILQSEQTFKNIRLPYTLSAKLAKQYPGYCISLMECKLRYIKDDATNITYKVKLSKGKKKKTVKLTV